MTIKPNYVSFFKRLTNQQQKSIALIPQTDHPYHIPSPNLKKQNEVFTALKDTTWHPRRPRRNIKQYTQEITLPSANKLSVASSHQHLPTKTKEVLELPENHIAFEDHFSVFSDNGSGEKNPY